MKSRSEELMKLKTFRESSDMSDKSYHKNELNFMAENGIRQLGPPRIGDFADRIMPEPLHLEVNSWQHLLDVIYKEAVRRGRFQMFIAVLSNSPRITEENVVPGCGLAYIAKEIEKHYAVETKRLKRLETRLIGSQAISLAQYRFVYFVLFFNCVINVDSLLFRDSKLLSIK